MQFRVALRAIPSEIEAGGENCGAAVAPGGCDGLHKPREPRTVGVLERPRALRPSRLLTAVASIAAIAVVVLVPVLAVLAILIHR